VGRDDLDRLLLGLSGRLVEVLGGREMLRLPVRPRERLVRDLLQEVLEEGVLAALRRARVGLHREHLLAHERGEHWLQLLLGQPRQRREPALREALPQHGRVLEDAPLL
jgi:hypothetical protein